MGVSINGLCIRRANLDGLARTGFDSVVTRET
jgi:hypothetical protein